MPAANTTAVAEVFATIGSMAISIPYLDPFLYIVAPLFLILVPWAVRVAGASKLPLLNAAGPFGLWERRARKLFMSRAKDLINKGLQMTDKFRIISDLGEVIVLHPKYLEELKNRPELSFSQWSAKAFCAHIPGFEAFKQSTSDDHIFRNVVQRKLSKSLGDMTQALGDETTTALSEIFTEQSTWHEVTMKPASLLLIARISARAFAGPELGRDPAWIDVTAQYTGAIFAAIRQLKMWPEALQGWVHWFLPTCRHLRQQLVEARKIITPVVTRRLAKKRELLAAGKPLGPSTDLIDWMFDLGKDKQYDPAILQLVISVAAIHTTSDLLAQVVYHVGKNQELLKALREEIVAVLSDGGWKESTFPRLRLMDSVLKESLRLKPSAMVSLRRIATKDFPLSDGTMIRKGQTIMVSAGQMMDPEIWLNPTKFDGYRFLRRREQEKQASYQLVSTTADHQGFGYGMYVCPGRFFADHALKVAFCHLLLKYEFEFPQGAEEPRILEVGFAYRADPEAKVLFRRRQEEIPL
ncbi:putative Cytochrome P450 [Seiridium cardinale]